jgi:two-component system, response regulator FlrC
MPGMNGVELAAVIEERWPGIPVLLISAHGAPPASYTGSFLSKPFSPDTLVSAVSDLLPPGADATPQIDPIGARAINASSAS